MLNNPKIAQANPAVKVNKAFVDALYQEAYGRYATVSEQALFKGKTVKDASNVILGSRSPWFDGNVEVSKVISPLSFPLKTIKVTQKFGERPEVYKNFGMAGHNGEDYKTKSVLNPFGKQEVFAAHDGIITVATLGNTGYGNYIKIYKQGLGETLYAHLSKILIAKGQEVRGGNIIGISGNTGFSTAPHLHFGFRPDKTDMKNGFYGWVDPSSYLPNT